MFMGHDIILVRYGEIFLKSEPVLRMWEKLLIRNIKLALKKQGIESKIRRKRGRIFIFTKNMKKACAILKKIFGIVSFSPCFYLGTSSLKKIRTFCEQNYGKWIKKNETFAIRPRRVGKHRYTSQKLAEDVGEIIDRKVNLKNPDKEIFIEVRDKETFIYTEVMKGLGGLPIPASGKVISLISGGIDSPVASRLMMKRGCKVVFVHFHSFPLLSRASIEKTKELVGVLSQYQLKSKIHFVPFSKIQTEIKTKIPAKYRIILYRRFMLRIAGEIANRESIKALVTGESLAQVSSQTLENLTTISEVSKIPILRPLIGMDKEEIINLAKSIGTYEISIKPQEDCCTLFIPKHPATRSNTGKIKELEKKLRIKKLMKKALDEMETIKI